MNIMQMDQIRLIQLQLSDQPFGGKAAEKSRAVSDAGKAQMHIGIQHAADAVAENIPGRMIARMAGFAVGKASAALTGPGKWGILYPTIP